MFWRLSYFIQCASGSLSNGCNRLSDVCHETKPVFGYQIKLPLERSEGDT